MLKTKPKSKTPPKVVASTFFQSPIKICSNKVIISLPKEILEEVNLNGGNAYWGIVNGVLQICGEQPRITIPLLSLKETTFTKNSN
jgi:hypothetical protein